MSAFANLKNSRKTSLSKINSAFDSEKKGSFEDTSHEEWKATVDKANNGFAEIRFLPGAEGDELPWVKIFTHGFKGPGGQWYIENSLTTIGKEDPVSDYNSKLWNSGVESDKTTARLQKRRLAYWSNILVVNDPANSDNNGKVFKFKYGKKIFDKIQDVMNPAFPDEAPVNPFDLWEGATFKLKIRDADGYRNYDKSEFASPTPAGAEDKLEEIYNSQFKLSDIVSEDKFKTYTELQTKMSRVLQLEIEAPKESYNERKTPQDAMSPVFNTESVVATPSSSSTVDEDEDPMAMFERLAQNS